jgi:hypothetical protein
MIDGEHMPIIFLKQKYLKLVVSLYLVTIFIQFEKFNQHNAIESFMTNALNRKHKFGRQMYK